MLRFLLSTLLLFFGLHLYSQSIKGTITTKDQTPISFANILLLDGEQKEFAAGTTSDENGRFELNVGKSGHYFLEISFLGYESYRQEIDLDQTMVLDDITMTSQINELETVELVGQKHFLKREHDKTTFLIEGNQWLEGKTGVEILRYAPNIWVDPFSGAIKLKGSVTKVLLNGHETIMQGQELLSYLEALSSEELKSIEIVSNPSSSFDASGTGGVINIITRTPQKGWTSALNTKQVFGKFHSHTNSLNINSRLSPKWNLSSTFLYEDRQLLNIEERAEEIESPKYGGYEYLKTDTTNLSRRYAGIQVQYDISEDDHIGLSFKGLHTTRNNIQHNDLNIDAITKNIFSTGDYSSEGLRNFLASGFNYYNKLDTLGQSISLVADYFYSTANTDELYDNAYFDEEGNKLKYTDVHPDTHTHIHTDRRKATIPVDNYIFSIRLDYVKPVSFGQLEMGAKYGVVNNVSELTLLNWFEGRFQLDEGNFYFFDYKEEIWAGYMSTSINQLFKTPWSAKLGLRTEYTNGYGNDMEEKLLVEKNYLDFFPSAVLSRPYGNDAKLSLSYSKRIDRPSYRSLNPSIFYLTDFATQVGNPNLAPKYTDAIEANFTHSSLMSLSMFYDNSTGEPREILKKVNQEDLEYQWRNIAHSSRIGASLSIRKKITDWWEVYLNTSVYHKTYRSNFEDLEVNFDDRLTTFQGGISTQIRLPYQINSEVSFQYNGDELFGQFKTGENYAFYFSFTKRVGNHWQLGLNVIDPFDQLRYRFVNDRNALLRTSQYRNSFRRAVELSVRFSLSSGAESKSVRLKESNSNLKRRSY